LAHEGVPRILYEHPVVEYIPLEVTTIRSGPLPEEVKRGRADLYPAVHVITDPKGWSAVRLDYPFAFSGVFGGDTPAFLHQPPASRRDIAVLALGFRAGKGIYRGHKVSLAAGEVGPVFHLFTLPRIYFYKERIDFVAYSETGVKLASAGDVSVGPRYERRTPAPGPFIP